MDYELKWQDEIADQWIYDFIIAEDSFPEVSYEVTDPDGDAEPGSPEFEIKNVIFTVNLNRKPISLWVFYDCLSEEIVECESWSNYDVDPEELGKAIFEINERWKLAKEEASADD